MALLGDFGLPPQLDSKPPTPPPIQVGRFSMPGYYLTQSIIGELFPNVIDGDDNIRRLITLREFTMMRFMNQITDKPGWDSKAGVHGQLEVVFDDTITAKWKSEALAAAEVTDEEGAAAQTTDITERMIDYCFLELRYKAKVFANTGVIVAYDGDVVKSDVVVPDELRMALKSAAAPLEDVTPTQRDWHPGSDDIVLDLVHPSLFPVVYGKTRILAHSSVTLENCVEQCGDGEILPVPSKSSNYSSKFQWLPCQVEFGSDGDSVKITSYINNLHPKSNQALYEAAQNILAKAIPLWSRTLWPLNSHIIRVPFDGPVYREDGEGEGEGDDEDEDYDYDEYEQRLMDWRKSHLVQPEPEDFVDEGDSHDLTKPSSSAAGKGVTTPLQIRSPSGGPNVCNLRDNFAERGLQVIVKLANIHLTPEKPQYGGGTWHVEGQLNEHICATALYYYDCSNITESRLAFRQQSDSEKAILMKYKQWDHVWLPAVFGCEQGEASVQYVGDVLAKERRLITFPNTFQHRVLPFELKDPTKSGHRKILALFLVDPHIQIISSAHVPCQRRDWWAEELDGKHALPDRLPLEIKQEVMGHVDDFPIALEEAKKLRLELMDERKSHDVIQDGKFNSTTFSLCEH